MTIEFQPSLNLPPLSWCARARKSGGVTIRHGADVETRADGFVEGAWNGNFDDFDFDQAEVLAGTGARLRDGALVFAAPFHPLERLFVLRSDHEILISNSLVFLLAEAQDGLDFTYKNYFFDLVKMVRRGIEGPTSTLRTRSGRLVELFRCCNLEIGRDLSLHRAPKPLGPAPACFADYYGALRKAAIELAANAAAPGRRKTYRLVAACSRGYDSTAATAIAREAGCQEGVTFVRSIHVSGHPLLGVKTVAVDDSGADTLRALGMSVTEYERFGLASLSGHPRAEFYLSPSTSTDASMRLMEASLRGSVLVSGRHGERYWGLGRRCRRSHLREVDDCVLHGQNLGEFRLRAGFLQFPVPYVRALHGPAIFRITHSPEMRPWRLGAGAYDRPIARRIAEEAGVPRAWFGQVKCGAGHVREAPNADSERDFHDFLQSSVPPDIVRRLDRRPLNDRTPRHRKLNYIRTQYSHLPFVSTAMDLLQTERMHVMWNSIHLYKFHWGFEKITSRYR